jgi:formiminotetrahydrofolate cyclodeaminase
MLLAMPSPEDLSQVTLEQFRCDVAGEQPMPAGVAIAAVSASFALGLVAKVLAVSSRRDKLAEGAAGMEPLIGQARTAAQAASQRMSQLASDDIAAFETYLAAKRLARTNESERQRRQESIDSAVRRAIDLPLAAAHEAASGLRLCNDVSAFISSGLTADLGVAAALLASALRAFLLCAESNVSQLAPEGASLRERVAIERDRLASAFRTADTVLEHARTVMQSTAEPASGR